MRREIQAQATLEDLSLPLFVSETESHTLHPPTRILMNALLLFLLAADAIVLAGV